MAVILSDSSAWSVGSGKRPETLRRWGEITAARLSGPGIITQWLFWSLGGNLGVCGKANVCHLGLDECLQSQVMLWDRSCVGFRWIRSLQQKTAEPESSVSAALRQMQSCRQIHGSPKVLGRWREAWWNTSCLGRWGWAFTGPQTKCVAAPTISVCLSSTKGWCWERESCLQKIAFAVLGKEKPIWFFFFSV